METTAVDFILQETTGPVGEGPGIKWVVYAKNSYFQLGTIEWVERKNAYDYVPNSNGKLMKITQDEATRRELIVFCKERTVERLESGGNRL